jgi:hypothetical protein
MRSAKPRVAVRGGAGLGVVAVHPRHRCEGGDFSDHSVGQTGQDICQVRPHWNAQTAAGLDDRENRGYLRPSLDTADVDPVLPAMEIFP